VKTGKPAWAELAGASDSTIWLTHGTAMSSIVAWQTSRNGAIACLICSKTLLALWVLEFVGILTGCGDAPDMLSCEWNDACEGKTTKDNL
jgi:hypothetical protein